MFGVNVVSPVTDNGLCASTDAVECSVYTGLDLKPLERRYLTVPFPDPRFSQPALLLLSSGIFYIEESELCLPPSNRPHDFV